MAGADKSYLTTIAIAFTVAITFIAVTLRLTARKLHRIPLGVDDYLLLLGAFFTILDALLYILSNKNGNGKHFDTLSEEQLVIYWKTYYASFQLYGAAITAIKLSILFFYRRIFSTPQFRKWLYGVGALVVAWLLANNLSAALQCIPPQKFWRKDIHGHCFNFLTFVQALQISNIILDAVILALPVSAVLRLQMSRSKKLSVLAVFLMGGLSVVFAIVRLVVLLQENQEDITYSTGKSSWTLVEPAIEVLAACLPTMAPLFHIGEHLPRLRTFWRALFSSCQSPDAHQDGRMDERMFRPNRNAAITSTAQGRSLDEQGLESDEVPLKSIGVRHELDWTEEHC